MNTNNDTCNNGSAVLYNVQPQLKQCDNIDMFTS